MLGQTVDARSPLPKWTLFCVLLVIAFGVAGAATGNVHFWMATIFPLVFVFVSWMGRHKDVVVTLEERGIVLFGTQHVLSYDEIQAVLVGANVVNVDTPPSVSGPMTIAHDHGRFFLPEKMNIPVWELAKFLVSRMPEKAEKEVHVSLVDYTNEQEAKFGQDRVTRVHQREFAHHAISKSAMSPFGAALFLSGVLWMVIAITLESKDKTSEAIGVWLGLSVFAIFVGGLLWLAGKAKSRTQQVDTKKHGRACIVITPIGLGLAQGDLQGKLRWDEIAGVKNGPAKSFGDRDGALQLLFSGGSILLFDIYDYSLTDIASLIRKHIGVSP